MRAALLLVLLLLPTATALRPEVDFFVVNEQASTSARNQTLVGELRVAFPEGGECGAGVPYSIRLTEVPAGVQGRFEPANGSIPPQDVTDREFNRSVRLELTFNRSVEAFRPVNLVMEASTSACGNLEAAREVSQSGTSVDYEPALRVTLASEEPAAWNIRFINEGNAPLLVEASVVQSSLGRVVSLVEPFTLAIGETRYATLGKEGLDTAAGADLMVTHRYGGTANERPPPGQETLRLYSPPSRGTPSLEASLAVAVVALAFSLRRSRA